MQLQEEQAEVRVQLFELLLRASRDESDGLLALQLISGPAVAAATPLNSVLQTCAAPCGAGC